MTCRYLDKKTSLYDCGFLQNLSFMYYIYILLWLHQSFIKMNQTLKHASDYLFSSPKFRAGSFQNLISYAAASVDFFFTNIQSMFTIYLAYVGRLLQGSVLSIPNIRAHQNNYKHETLSGYLRILFILLLPLSLVLQPFTIQIKTKENKTYFTSCIQFKLTPSTN